MPLRQSVLALYGHLSDRLQSLGETATPPAVAKQIRATVMEVLGGRITGSVGERGWYGELLRYCNDHRTPATEPLTQPTLAEVRADFRQDEPLPPSWAAQAIAAAGVLDAVNNLMAGFAGDAEMAGFAGDTEPVLPDVLAAAPAREHPERPIRIGPDAAGPLAQNLTDAFARSFSAQVHFTRSDFESQLQMMAMAGTLSLAVATQTMDARLRKVKREYTSLITTSAKWDIPIGKLEKVIEPENWDNFYAEFFCAMIRQPDNNVGWSRVHEEVSGDCARYRLSTALKFWKGRRGNGLYLNYDLDENRNGTDTLVLIDNGYISITPDPDDPVNGVVVDTSKELLISGMSATAMVNMAATLGWATNASDMFHDAAKSNFQGVPFQPSQPAAAPTPDTSTSLPVIVPTIPGDMRQDMIGDAAATAQDGIHRATKLAAEYGQQWEDGIDATDVRDLAAELGEDVKEYSIDVFNKGTENFRPRPQPSTAGQ